jgi:signal peptidase I
MTTSVVAPQSPVPPPRPRLSQLRHGWVWLVVVTLSRAYLIFLLTLAVVAVVPAFGSWNSYVVKTGSMLPRIHPGDVVVASPLGSSAPIPLGRVIAFTSVNRTDTHGHPEVIVHRVVSLSPTSGYRTAGDANANFDSDPLHRSQIVGEGRLLVPLIGLPLVWLSTRTWFPLIFWTLLTVLALLITAANPLGRLFTDGEDDNDSTGPAGESGGSTDMDALTAMGADPNASKSEPTHGSQFTTSRFIKDRRWAITLSALLALALIFSGTYSLHLASGNFSARKANALNTWAFKSSKALSSTDFTTIPSTASAVWTANTVKMTNTASVLSNNYPLTNVEFTATGSLANNNNGGWGVWVRASAASNQMSGYCFTVDASQKYFNLRWWTAGHENTSSLASVKFPTGFTASASHVVLVRASVNSFTAFVDGTLVMSTTLPTSNQTVNGYNYIVPTGGQYGMRTWSQAVATIGSLVVTPM